VELVIVAVGQAIATAIGVSLVARLGETILASLRERFVERALGLPLDQLERAGSGDLTTRVTNDVSVIADAVREALPELGQSVLTVVLTLGALAVLDWRFLLAALVAVPIQIWTVSWYVPRAKPLYAKQREAVGTQQQQLLDTIGGAATVRAFRLTDTHLDRVRQRSNSAVDLALQGVRLVTRFYARLNLAEFVGLSAILAMGFLLVGANAVTVGVATAAALYFHSLFGPITTALALVDDAQAATASLARLIGVADLPRPRAHKSGPAGRCRREDRWHQFLLCGRSSRAAGRRPVRRPRRAGGAGRRQRGRQDHPGQADRRHPPAVRRLHHPRRRVPGRARAHRHQPDRGPDQPGGARLRRALADDLRLSRPAATDAELLAALGKIGALSWVDSLPDGLATVVGEGGHQLTVTQAQQLALVRLVLADPPIAILDEATADAGSAGARVLESSAAAALEGRTALVVAHRLTQAAASDRIVVLDAGAVVETGTHEELVAAGGQYAKLWTAWSGQRA